MHWKSRQELQVIRLIGYYITDILEISAFFADTVQNT